MAIAEYFHENYREALARCALPLIYTRQNSSAVGDSGLHQHVDHYALYVVHSGRGVHEINSHPYAITRGDVYIAAPGSIHAYRSGENLEVDAFCFQIDLFHEDEIVALRTLSGFRGLFLDTAEWSSHRLHLAPEHRQRVEVQLRELLEELARAQTHMREAEVLTRVLFFRLLITLARLWNENATQQGLADYRDVGLAEVLRFCEARFAEEISVPQLAAKMFLSPSRFAELFKKEMGVPPGAYLRRLRLDKAQTLLRTTDQSAQAIAQSCGFSDATQFSRAFKIAFAHTPSAYRAKFRETHRPPSPSPPACTRT
jgi:AraC-like DNA-binding protein